LIDLIETTKIVHYENFRIRQMCKMPKNAIMDNCDPFTQMEQERKACDKETEETRNAKERIFKERVSLHERRIAEKSLALDNEEKENNKTLEQKRAKFDKLLEEVNELRRAAGLNSTGSTSSIGRHSPAEKPKKRTGTLGQIFGNK